MKSVERDFRMSAIGESREKNIDAREKSINQPYASVVSNYEVIRLRQVVWFVVKQCVKVLHEAISRELAKGAA